MMRLDPGSFRDPSNRVFVGEEAVIRALDNEGAKALAAMEGSAFFGEAQRAGSLITGERVDRPADMSDPLWTTFVAHPKLAVWSYPYEWCFSMLRSAALIQLELLSAALADEATCKDATPYNVQFQGTRPLFIDYGSFEPYQPGDPWYGYLQFCQLYLYPLLFQAYADIAFQPLLVADVDGITPELAARVLGPLRLWRKGMMVHVALHAQVQQRFAKREQDVKADLRKSGFSKRMIEANVAGLTKLVESLRWKRSESEWSSYVDRPHYTSDELAAKEAFVTQAAARRRWDIAWDVGCNDGRFSRLVSPHSDHVIAFDSDHLVVDLLFRSLAGEGPSNILPLVVDLAKPSPGLGWRGGERQAFLDRNRPDLVLFLAVIHHLAITANVPLGEILALLRSLGAVVVLEFPTEDDPMVQRLMRNKRAGVHDGYRLAAFEQLLESAFEVTRREELASGTRVMFELTPAS